jgi:hypothetical protein
MSTALRSQLDELARSFAEGVLSAIRAASIEELRAESGGRRRGGDGGGGQPDPVRMEATLAKVLAAVRATRGKGLRAEEIRKQLGLDVREVPRVLKEGLRTKKLKAKGQKRATVYRTK